jgi:hypothetical protein
MNLARIEFFGLCICSLCKVQTVCFEKLAVSFDSSVKVESSLLRIQRFMSGYLLDTNLIAHLIFELLPHEPPYRLSKDRANWKFGSTDINILVIAIVYDGVAFPSMYKMMPKAGNFSTAERIKLVEQFIRILALIASTACRSKGNFREQRIVYLNDNRIRYHLQYPGELLGGHP